MKNKLPGVRVLILLLAVGASTAAVAGKAATPEAFEFSVVGMTCGSCADAAAKALASVPGVLESTVDFKSKLGRVRSDGTVSQQQIRDTLASAGFEARFDGEALDSDPLPEELRSGLDIRTISHGEKIRSKDHLAHGKITLFDYYADWCGPCQLLSPKLERLVLRYENVALRKVDIVDYESAAAAQATREFRMPGLPFTRIFDERGKLLGQVHGNRAEDIEALIRPHARIRS